MSMFEAIGGLLVLGFGSHAVLTGSLQLGDWVGILLLMAFLYDPISRLHQLNQLVQAGRAAGERVFEILDEDAEPGVAAKIKSVEEPDRFPRIKRDEAVSFPYKPALPIIGDIRYEDVSFSYVDGLSALRHISFHALPGTTTALVGATGAV